MSDEEEDDVTQTSREEERLSYELYYLIVRTICEKGFVKLSDVRKAYQKTVSNDKTVNYRPLPEVLKSVNENLKHWQGWDAVLHEDRLTYVDASAKEPMGLKEPSETERALGLLKTTLMYVFVATKPSSKYPGVPHDELMTFLETTISTSDDNKLTPSHMDLIKKHIQPNARADFVKKGYLVVSKSLNENDEEVFRYEWGPTARQTVDPLVLVRIFQKMTEMTPAQLKEQLTRAQDWKNEQQELIERGGILPTRGGAK